MDTLIPNIGQVNGEQNFSYFRFENREREHRKIKERKENIVMVKNNDQK